MAKQTLRSRDPNRILQRMFTTELHYGMFSDKADCLIGHGIRLFHRKGVHGTGLNELLAAAGMGKSQFYHYFENKEDFVCAVLRREMDVFLSRVASNIRTLECLDDFDAWFEPYLALARLPQNLGCPVGVIASEMSPSSEAVRKVAEESLQRWASAISEAMQGLKNSQPMIAEFDPIQVGQYMACTIQGALLMGRTLQDIAPISNTREQLKHYLNSFRQR